MQPNLETVGRIVFYLGLVISVVAGFMDIGAMGVYALVAFGVIVGLLNVTGKEVHTFLLATIALLISGIALSTVLGAVGAAILSAFVAFVAGAALVVALREVIVVTKGK